MDNAAQKFGNIYYLYAPEWIHLRFEYIRVEKRVEKICTSIHWYVWFNFY